MKTSFHFEFPIQEVENVSYFFRLFHKITKQEQK